MVVPFGNYLAFRDAHPDGENTNYRMNDTFSQDDHMTAAISFFAALCLTETIVTDFEWISEGAIPTGIQTMSDVRSQMADVWYTLDGRKLNGKPTAKGIYVNGGRKVVIK